MTRDNTAAGIALMILACLIFALQDVLFRFLGATVPVWLVVMIRYWVFLAVVTAFAARRRGGIRAAVATKRPLIQIARGLLLAFEIGLSALAFMRVGLVEFHAVFASAPLIVTALSGPLLGERVGWRRWLAIGAGFAGVLVILQPGPGFLTPATFLTVLPAVVFALYGLATRYVLRYDSVETSFFWVGLGGAVAMTAMGLPQWQPLSAAEWTGSIALGLLALLGNWIYVHAYNLAEASAIQPFAYFSLIFGSSFGILIWGDSIGSGQIAGALMVVGAGVFTWARERRLQRATSASFSPRGPTLPDSRAR